MGARTARSPGDTYEARVVGKFWNRNVSKAALVEGVVSDVMARDGWIAGGVILCCRHLVTGSAAILILSIAIIEPISGGSCHTALAFGRTQFRRIRRHWLVAQLPTRDASTRNTAVDVSQPRW